MRKILREIDLIILVVIALATGTLSVLDFIDVAQFQAPNYPLFTLLSMVAVHLIVSYFSQEDFRNDTKALLDRIAKGAEVNDFRIFKDSAEIESYLAKRIIEAKKSVCDLSWKAKISEGFSARNRQLAHGYMDKCITEVSDRIPYREIFIFNDRRRVERLVRRIKENKNGYSCRYFKEDTLIPRLQFVLVDDEEVFFFASSASSILCSFRSQELCKVFRSYYDEAWNKATPIKEGPKINYEEVGLVEKTCC